MNSPSSPTMPPAVHHDRDADGRLERLCFDSGTATSKDQAIWLIAVDGSTQSLHAVNEAAALASASTTTALHLINVQPWLSHEAAEAELAARGLAATEEARAFLANSGMAWHLHVMMGDPATVIVALAEHIGSRTIVVGSRGLGAAENLLLGSVAYKVIHLSRGSVLVVR